MALLKVGVILSTMIVVSNWMSALVRLDPHISQAGTSEKFIGMPHPDEGEDWQLYSSAQGKCVCTILMSAQCRADSRHTHMQQLHHQMENISHNLELVRFAVLLDLQRLRDSENLLESVKRKINTKTDVNATILQELWASVSLCGALVTRWRTDVQQLQELMQRLQQLRESLMLLKEKFSTQHHVTLQQRESLLQRHLETCASTLNCGRLTGISSPLILRSSGSRFGCWMMDSSLGSSDTRVWVMDGFYKGKRVLEYQTLKDFTDGQNVVVHHLPHPWAGTGHVVYNGCLYYNKHGSDVLVRYDLSSSQVLHQRQLHQAGFNNTFPYSWGGLSDVDLMADESGLWVVFSTVSNGGNLVLGRLDPLSLELLQVWDTGFSKRSAGEAFVICGTLYVTNSHLAGAAVNFLFHTASMVYEYTDLPFPNLFSHLSMIDYNPRLRALLSWNNGQQVLYHLTLLQLVHTRPAHWKTNTESTD